jgi:hypothetical protein
MNRFDRDLDQQVNAAEFADVFTPYDNSLLGRPAHNPHLPPPPLISAANSAGTTPRYHDHHSPQPHSVPKPIVATIIPRLTLDHLNVPTSPVPPAASGGQAARSIGQRRPSIMSAMSDLWSSSTLDSARSDRSEEHKEASSVATTPLLIPRNINNGGGRRETEAERQLRKENERQARRDKRRLERRAARATTAPTSDYTPMTPSIMVTSPSHDHIRMITPGSVALPSSTPTGASLMITKSNSSNSRRGHHGHGHGGHSVVLSPTFHNGVASVLVTFPSQQQQHAPPSSSSTIMSSLPSSTVSTPRMDANKPDPSLPSPLSSPSPSSLPPSSISHHRPFPINGSALINNPHQATVTASSSSSRHHAPQHAPAERDWDQVSASSHGSESSHQTGSSIPVSSHHRHIHHYHHAPSSSHHSQPVPSSSSAHNLMPPPSSSTRRSHRNRSSAGVPSTTAPSTVQPVVRSRSHHDHMAPPSGVPTMSSSSATAGRYRSSSHQPRSRNSPPDHQPSSSRPATPSYGDPHVGTHPHSSRSMTSNPNGHISDMNMHGRGHTPMYDPSPLNTPVRDLGPSLSAAHQHYPSHASADGRQPSNQSSPYTNMDTSSVMRDMSSSTGRPRSATSQSHAHRLPSSSAQPLMRRPVSHDQLTSYHPSSEGGRSVKGNDGSTSPRGTILNKMRDRLRTMSTLLDPNALQLIYNDSIPTTTPSLSSSKSLSMSLPSTVGHPSHNPYLELFQGQPPNVPPLANTGLHTPRTQSAIAATVSATSPVTSSKSPNLHAAHVSALADTDQLLRSLGVGDGQLPPSYTNAASHAYDHNDDTAITPRMNGLSSPNGHEHKSSWSPSSLGRSPLRQVITSADSRGGMAPLMSPSKWRSVAAVNAVDPEIILQAPSSGAAMGLVFKMQIALAVAAEEVI